MRITSGRVLLLLFLICTLEGFAQQRLTAADARLHIGQQATVCGTVASVHFASRSKGEPTFVNLDKPYPNQIFTILIWGSDRPRFGNPEQSYSGKRLCVTGLITVYRDVPEVVAHDPAVIKVE